MIQRGLRTSILVNMIILLLVGMFLIDFVLTISVQRDLVKAERSKGELLLTAIESYFQKNPREDRSRPAGAPFSRLNKLLVRQDLNCARIMDRSGSRLYSFSRQCDYAEDLEELARQAMRFESQKSGLRGKTWGVFWTQKSELMLAAPLYDQKDVIGAAAISISLEPLYKSLRQSQKILLVYMIINTLLLTLVGLYRLSKIYFRPVQRLVRIAETYEDENELIFSVRKQDNELNKLSNALNLMMKRISADKEKLRQTVDSLKKANLDLKQAQDEMIRAGKLASIGRLSSGIAHEIGNPIGIVIGYIELLRQDHLPAADRVEYLDRAEAEINRINKIIRQLLDLSRPSQNLPAVVSVHDILNDMIRMLDAQPIVANMALKLDFQAEVDRVFADADQLRQVFLNLVINAADAVAGDADRTGELFIQTELLSVTHHEAIDCRETLKIRFRDNGCGISADHIANIFDPFYTTKEPGKGTGLGLSVSFMIIENLGGSMKVKSSEGSGTMMILLLPVFSAGMDKNAAA